MDHDFAKLLTDQIVANILRDTGELVSSSYARQLAYMAFYCN